MRANAESRLPGSSFSVRLSPSATWRVQLPAKQSAWSSLSMDGWSEFPARSWIAWPHSCANTSAIEKSPKFWKRSGKSLTSSYAT